MAEDSIMANQFTKEFGDHPNDVTLCGSKKNQKKWERVAEQLEDAGLVVKRPNMSAHLPWSEQPDHIVAQQKSKFVREALAYISQTRVLLVCNYRNNDQANHIGANALLQMTAAYIWNKPIYVLGDIPSTPNRDEILALQPKVLQGDLNNLIQYLKEGEL